MLELETALSCSHDVHEQAIRLNYGFIGVELNRRWLLLMMPLISRLSPYFSPQCENVLCDQCGSFVYGLPQLVFIVAYQASRIRDVAAVDK